MIFLVFEKKLKIKKIKKKKITFFVLFFVETLFWKRPPQWKFSNEKKPNFSFFKKKLKIKKSLK